LKETCTSVLALRVRSATTGLPLQRAGRAENLGRFPQASAGTLCHDMGHPAVSIEISPLSSINVRSSRIQRALQLVGPISTERNGQPHLTDAGDTTKRSFGEVATFRQRLFSGLGTEVAVVPAYESLYRALVGDAIIPGDRPVRPGSEKTITPKACCNRAVGAQQYDQSPRPAARNSTDEMGRLRIHRGH
jgi:hypothetical protein